MLNYRSPWMDEELDMFQSTVAKFIDTEMLPYDEQWRKQGHVGREIWSKVGQMGMLCMDIPAEYGGAGCDYRYEAIFYQEQARRGINGFGQGVHSVCAHYILNHGREEQKRTLLPKLASGEFIGSIGMTEPGAGSDLKGIRTKAVRDGDEYVINGSKIFISNGYLTDLVALVVRTDSDSLSILLVETRDLPGYSTGKPLSKAGQKAQDTCELFFEDVRVPVSCLLGEVEGKGMYQLMSDLPYERTIIGTMAMGAIEGAIEMTLEYTRDRNAFGQSVFDFQNSRFKLAEVATEAQLGRVFLDYCIQQVVDGTLDPAIAAMGKWWLTDKQQSIADECLQLHGGYGYMDEYTVSRMFVDARVQRIYGGANEIMKEIISRSL